MWSTCELQVSERKEKASLYFYTRACTTRIIAYTEVGYIVKGSSGFEVEGCAVHGAVGGDSGCCK